MMLLALSGKRGSGKSSVARRLKEEYGASIISFADALREELIAVGFDAELINMKPTPEPIRKLLVAYAMARRYVDPDYFVKKLLGSLAYHYKVGSGVVVIDDMRFTNEANKLRQHNAILVRVELEEWSRHHKIITEVDYGPSETDLDNFMSWDFLIKAKYGDPVGLYNQLDMSLKRYL